MEVKQSVCIAIHLTVSCSIKQNIEDHENADRPIASQEQSHSQSQTFYY